ncbi:MAG: NAD(P)-dependent oxidoreductase [Mycoplasma sp.]|nr:NAD(P)-dependent oxidoreductase [Mycoplasma sp.]
MTKIIVNGASSFIGRNLVNFLLDKKCIVYSVIRNIENKKYFNNNSNLKIINLSSNEIDKLHLMINEKYIDYYFDFSWIGTGIKKNNYVYQQHNIQNTINNFLQSQNLKCKKYIGAGSFYEKEFRYLIKRKQNHKVKINNKYFYAIFKELVKNVCNILENNGSTNFVWLNISNVYGPGEISDRFISNTFKNILQNKKINVSKHNFLYDFIYIDDAIDLIYDVQNESGTCSVYNICSNSPRYFHWYIKKINEIVGNNFIISCLESDYTQVHLKKEDFLDNFCSKWKNKNFTSFEEGIKKTYEWWKKQIK